MKQIYRKRSIVKRVCFDEREWLYLKDKIEASPFNNFQNFAWLLLLTGEVHMTDYKELEQLNYEVNRIGNNINQLTKLAHEFDEIASEDIFNLQN